MRKYLLHLLPAFLLGACFLCGCNKNSPTEIAVFCNGETLTLLELMNGSEQTGITAVVSPSDYEGAVVWTSEDAGIVKIIETNDEECTLLAKKTGSTVITAQCDGISASFRVHVLKNQEALSARDTALTINDIAYSTEMCNVCYADLYYEFVETYGDYTAYYYGLDTTTGLASLAEQYCDYSSDGTWYGYFLNAAAEMLQETQALCDYASENGILLTEEEAAGIREDLETQSGSDNIADYLSSRYGAGVTDELYIRYMENKTLADKAYDTYIDSLSYTDEEIDEHYAELGYTEDENNYPVTAMRHVLIMAEADENGEYSEEAIADAHAHAVQLFEEWFSGEQTEDRFAELANENSEDGGSNTTGGLYENIYQGQMVEGIDSWLFDEGRRPGDTAVIDNNGSYVGTHIVYFVGFGNLYSRVLSMEDLKNTAISEWFSALIGDYTAEPGADYGSIGKF